jgi:hypothetical protein
MEYGAAGFVNPVFAKLKRRRWQVNDQNSSNEDIPKPSGEKKPYKTPTFRFETVFEVSALACGKIHSTQGGCHFVQKAS